MLRQPGVHLIGQIAEPNRLFADIQHMGARIIMRENISKLDSLPARMILRNEALLIVPPMIISMGLWGALPDAYGPEISWKDIPEWLGLFENIFRILAFSLPGILYFGKTEKAQSLGWYLYLGGMVVYLASYLTQIIFPASAWGQSVIGFTTGAWSTSFWLAGIGFVCARSWLPIPWHRVIYFLSAAIFLTLHTGHAWLVYTNLVQ